MTPTLSRCSFPHSKTLFFPLFPSCIIPTTITCRRFHSSHAIFESSSSFHNPSPHVQHVVSYFERSNQLYPTKDEIVSLAEELNLSLSEMRVTIAHARKHLERRNYTENDRIFAQNFARRVLESLTPRHRPSAVKPICLNLQRLTGFSAKIFYRIVRGEAEKFNRIRVGQQERALVEKFVKEGAALGMNALEICQELESDLQIHMPRSQLYHFVRHRLKRSERKQVGSIQKRIIENHVRRSPNLWNIPAVCDEIALINTVSLPRKQLYELVLNAHRKLALQLTPKEQIALVKQYVEQEIPSTRSAPSKSISSLCKGISIAHTQLEGMSKTQLYALVRQQLSSTRRHVHVSSASAREVVKNYMTENPNAELRTACDDLETMLPNLPRKAVYKIAYNHVQKKNRAKIDGEERDAIRKALNERMSDTATPPSVQDLCSEVRDKFSHVPQPLLYQITYKHIQKLEKIKEKS